MSHSESEQRIINRACAKMEQLRADAERWRYVREKMAVGHGHPGDRHFYFYDPDGDRELYVGRGDTIDEIIDKLRGVDS